MSYFKKPKKHGPAFQDLTGNRYRNLTAIRYLGAGSWECLCDCGNTSIAKIHGLKSGQRVSCGCMGKKRACSKIGLKINHMTVLDYEVPKEKGKRGSYICKCDCGTIKKILTSSFKKAACCGEESCTFRINLKGNLRNRLESTLITDCDIKNIINLHKNVGYNKEQIAEIVKLNIEDVTKVLIGLK